MYLPPQRADLLSPAAQVAGRLRRLIGRELTLTGKTRTDGANVRKLIAATLEDGPLPAPASDADWRCVPPKAKGVPGLLREYLDTYIVTSGTSYNLQVWNRNPAARSVQIEFIEGPPLLSCDARFVLLRVDTTTHRIRCVAVLSPEYIVRRFGRFGRPTVKQQLIISPSARTRVYNSPSATVFFPDDPRVESLTSRIAELRQADLRSPPERGSLLRLDTIRDRIISTLVGAELRPSATKTRGQALEVLVATALGYGSIGTTALVGGYPDIRHQALEVKAQDAPTVDLGRYSPQFDEEVPGCPGFTTQSVRYLIALTDPETSMCRGVVISPGGRLGELFTYVSDQSFKCQRSIPMAFFDAIDGQAISDP